MVLHSGVVKKNDFYLFLMEVL